MHSGSLWWRFGRFHTVPTVALLLLLDDECCCWPCSARITLLDEGERVRPRVVLSLFALSQLDMEKERVMPAGGTLKLSTPFPFFDLLPFTVIAFERRGGRSFTLGNGRASSRQAGSNTSELSFRFVRSGWGTRRTALFFCSPRKSTLRRAGFHA
uniref:Putative secreted protein n=1 Tax=Anopheles marajoara TaxID=58244 RepID=A0A2M4C6A5_9DIPT